MFSIVRRLNVPELAGASTALVGGSDGFATPDPPILYSKRMPQEGRKKRNCGGRKEMRAGCNRASNPRLSRYSTVLWAIQPLMTGRGGIPVPMGRRLAERPQTPPCASSLDEQDSRVSAASQFHFRARNSLPEESDVRA